MKDLLEWAIISLAKEQPNEKTGTQSHGAVQGEGGSGGVEVCLVSTLKCNANYSA